MHRNIPAFENNEFDIVVIGGGITGACIAADASARGLNVALIERADFAAATSSASSKVLHGGIRYLQQGRIDKVRESALERVYFQRLAPHLTRYVPFLVPTYTNWRKSKLIMVAGMSAYQAICFGQNKLIQDPNKKVPGWESLSKNEVNDRIPGFRETGLTGGVMFYESHMHNSERMVLAFLDHAHQMGSVIANYVEATGFIYENKRVCGVKCVDLETQNNFEIRSKIVVNASGPWIPGLNKSLDNNSLTGVVTGYSKGAHILTEQLTKDCAIALPTNKQSEAVLSRGGRHVFIIPWRGHSLIGTTYTPYKEKLENVAPTEDDIQELIADINNAFGGEKLKRNQVKFSYAGIYPLVTDSINPNLYQGTGDYRIVNHAKEDGMPGLISAFGAKFTTARLLAEKTLDEIGRGELKMKAGSPLREIALTSGKIDNIKTFTEEKKLQFKELFDAHTTEHLVTNYGTAVDEIALLVQDNPELRSKISNNHDTIHAEILYSINKEMALHLEDAIFRRTGMGTLGQLSKEALLACANLMAGELGWDNTRIETEVTRVENRYTYQ